MKLLSTHCGLRLGDNLQHLQFVRKVALANPGITFTHYCRPEYIYQLEPLLYDLPPSVRLGNLVLENPPKQSVDAWKGAGDYWYRHPDRNNYVSFYIEWFDLLAKKLGVKNPIKTPDDFLFDYPAMRASISKDWKPFDFLVVNSPPLSNQWPAYNAMEMEGLVNELLSAGHRVMTTHPTKTRANCTQDFSFSVTGIGAVSTLCKYIVMVSTGPSWPTFNVWNNNTVQLRIILIESERIEITPNTVHCNRVSLAREVMKDHKLI